MNLMLGATCLLMWVLAIGVSVVLWWLVKDIMKLEKRIEKLEEEGQDDNNY